MSEGFLVSDDSAGQGTPLAAWNASAKLRELAVITADLLVPPNCRAVIIAPHPDDEVLGCGGLMSQLAQLERKLLVISVTDGTGSHPGSTLLSVERLAEMRPQESAEALHRLQVPAEQLEWARGGFQDGAVADEEDRLVTFLEQHLGPADVVFATWSGDGHGDHEAVGRASARACLASGAQLHEFPVWAWHWADPEDPRLPWERARKLLLDPMTLARKRHAAQAFVSQLEGDSGIGLSPVLPAAVLERLLQPFEVVFT
ncbi:MULTISPECIES: PIG-L deacetylase family protein [Pseudomonas syringae group]|uniref:PIG-L deacetylase family protein n=1 Tax=Pseudomonas syringae group TaxID=136849 RepID=UPI0006D61F20|nr:PIG-L family deacetylase [Pseudomonas coronafaciens]KPX29436.1 LmbE-like protein [Pseudomonas coronafaciens pv. garcae]RMS91411.1 LmbE-like protein [Pseudomonas coronafaciens pv. oryzae]RMS93315.1 LmbE-like protein [Pseudomonas coronafaciens pv. oryzae]RMV87336.1 LmbE-like protein [Pseudomonas coronafaciens pv. garcae]